MNQTPVNKSCGGQPLEPKMLKVAEELRGHLGRLRDELDEIRAKINGGELPKPEPRPSADGLAAMLSESCSAAAGLVGDAATINASFGE